MERLLTTLTHIDGAPFGHYLRLEGRVSLYKDYSIHFRRIQGSPGAFPASVCSLSMRIADLGLPSHCFLNASRKMATADYLLRAFSAGVNLYARQNRGSKGSGSFQPLRLPPQILKRNLVRFTPTDLEIDFRISLPGSSANRIIGREAIAMFHEELPAIIAALKSSVSLTAALKKHCDTVEDFFYLQNRLEEYSLAAFIADSAVLPRESGVSQMPMQKGAKPFRAPPELAVKVSLPNAGQVRGMGIRTGVNVLIGGGFHGKSTILNALAKAVYPHIPGDGREHVATQAGAAYIPAEEGRSIRGVDISAFLPELPGTADPKWFFTGNASGSTSQAAAVIEAVAAKTKFLLLDEDASATNFLIRDHTMRLLMPEDRSIPFYDRVRELHARFGISTLIVVGGSSEYLGVADHVFAMQNYQPVCMREKVRQLSLSRPEPPAAPFSISGNRGVLARCFDPSYNAERLGKTLAMRIKPLRLQEKVLEYGNERLDLSRLAGLVDPEQVIAIGYALLFSRNHFGDKRLSPAAIAMAICSRIDRDGLDILCPTEAKTMFLANFRPLELAGAIERLRSLVCERVESEV